MRCGVAFQETQGIHAPKTYALLAAAKDRGSGLGRAALPGGKRPSHVHQEGRLSCPSFLLR